MAHNPKRQATVEKRQNADKVRLLEQLKKMPIIHVACERAKVGRSTFYRWREKSKTFDTLAEEAIAEGMALINDMSESQLISLIQGKHWQATKFWLENNHPRYAKKVQVSGLNGEPIQFTITYEQKF